MFSSSRHSGLLQHHQQKRDAEEGRQGRSPYSAALVLAHKAALVAAAVALAATSITGPSSSSAAPSSSLFRFADAHPHQQPQHPQQQGVGVGGGVAAAAPQQAQQQHVGGIDPSRLRGVRILTDAQCEGVLFPDSALHTHRPYFIMLYSPTCLHCQELMPHFDAVAVDVVLNGRGYGDRGLGWGDQDVEGREDRRDGSASSGGGSGSGGPSSNSNATTNPQDQQQQQQPLINRFAPQFAVVNMVENPRLRALFEAKSLPAFIYSIGGAVYPYQGAASVEGFVRTAEVLMDAYRYNNPHAMVPGAANANADAAKANAAGVNSTTASPPKMYSPYLASIAASNANNNAPPPPPAGGAAAATKASPPAAPVDRPPLSIPVRDISTFDRFLPFWDRTTSFSRIMNPMGATGTHARDYYYGAGPSGVDEYADLSTRDDLGIDFGITPPLFVVCQPPTRDSLYLPTKESLPKAPSSSSSETSTAVRRPAFATFLESVISTGKARFATIVAQTREEKDKNEERDERFRTCAKTGKPKDAANRKVLPTHRSNNNKNAAAPEFLNPVAVGTTSDSDALLSSYSQDPFNVFAMLRDTCTNAFLLPDNARKPSAGPNGEVLMVYSPDRSQKPYFYHGYSDGINNGRVIKKKWAGEGVSEVSYGSVLVNYTVPAPADAPSYSRRRKDDMRNEPIMIVNTPNVNDEASIRTRIEPLTAMTILPTFRTSKALSLWIWENSYSLIEFGSFDVLAALPKRTRLGVFVLPHAVGEIAATAMEGSGGGGGGGSAQSSSAMPQQQLHNASHYYAGLNWLSRKRYANYRNINRNSIESGVAAALLLENRRWPIPTQSGMKIVSIAQTDFDAAGWSVRWANHAPMQILVVSAVTHAAWLKRIGAGPPSDASGDAAGNASPYFFAYDAINNKIAMMSDWLIAPLAKVFTGRRAPLHAAPDPLTSATPELPLLQHRIPPLFEPKTGLALKLMDQFLNDFAGIGNEVNNNVASNAVHLETSFKAAERHMDGSMERRAAVGAGGRTRSGSPSISASMLGVSADDLSESISSSSSGGGGRKGGAAAASAAPRMDGSRFASASISNAASANAPQVPSQRSFLGSGGGGHHASPSPSRPSAPSNAAAGAGAPPPPSRPSNRMRIQYTSYSAAFVAKVVEVFPPADGLLQWCNDDSFLFVIVCLIGVFSVFAVGLSLFSGMLLAKERREGGGLMAGTGEEGAIRGGTNNSNGNKKTKQSSTSSSSQKRHQNINTINNSSTATPNNTPNNNSTPTARHKMMSSSNSHLHRSAAKPSAPHQHLRSGSDDIDTVNNNNDNNGGKGGGNNNRLFALLTSLSSPISFRRRAAADSSSPQADSGSLALAIADSRNNSSTGGDAVVSSGSDANSGMDATAINNHLVSPPTLTSRFSNNNNNNKNNNAPRSGGGGGAISPRQQQTATNGGGGYGYGGGAPAAMLVPAASLSPYQQQQQQQMAGSSGRSTPPPPAHLHPQAPIFNNNNSSSNNKGRSGLIPSHYNGGGGGGSASASETNTAATTPSAMMHRPHKHSNQQQQQQQQQRQQPNIYPQQFALPSTSPYGGGGSGSGGASFGGGGGASGLGGSQQFGHQHLHNSSNNQLQSSQQLGGGATATHASTPSQSFYSQSSLVLGGGGGLSHSQQQQLGGRGCAPTAATASDAFSLPSSPSASARLLYQHQQQPPMINTTNDSANSTNNNGSGHLHLQQQQQQHHHHHNMMGTTAVRSATGGGGGGSPSSNASSSPMSITRAGGPTTAAMAIVGGGGPTAPLPPSMLQSNSSDSVASSAASIGGSNSWMVVPRPPNGGQHNNSNYALGQQPYQQTATSVGTDCMYTTPSPTGSSAAAASPPSAN